MNAYSCAPCACTFVSAVAAFFSVSSFAGSPLVTDDTGIIDAGEWEFTLAFSGDTSDAGESFNLPEIETEYGLGNGMQIGFSMARAYVNPRSMDSMTGLGEGSVPFKWRFYESGGKTVVLAPSYSFPLSGSSQRRGIVEDLRVLSVPVVASIENADWVFTAQVGYDMTSSGPNGLFYGTWAGYSLAESVQLMLEIYREEVVGESADNTNWRLALTVGVGEKGGLMFGYGGNASSDLPVGEEVDNDFYVGYLYKTG